MPDTAEKLLSIAEVREALGVSDATMYRLLEHGELPRIKIGRRTLIDPEDLREFIAGRRVVGDGEDPKP